MRVGYDNDGVGYFFGPSVRNYLATVGRDVPEMHDHACTKWDFYQAWGMHRDEFDKHVDAGVDAGIIFGPGNGLTRPNFFESIRTVKALGHEVIIVTHRYQGSPGMAERNTEKWLEPVRHLIDEVHYAEDKTSVPTDTFVEDNLANYDALIAAGVKAFLINRPWNEVKGGDARNRIDDVSDYTDAIVKITEQGFADLTLA